MRAAVAVGALLAAATLAREVAAAETWEGFRIPPHHAGSWTLGATGSLGSSDGSSGPQSSARSFGLASLSTGIVELWDSDPRRTAVSLSLRGGGSRQRLDNHQRQTLFPSDVQAMENRDHLQQLFQGWIAALDHRWYPWTTNLGWTVGLRAQGDYEQDWRRTSQLSTFQSTTTLVSSEQRGHEAWEYHYLVSGRVGLGFGRVRDVTDVFDARVFEERLLAAGALTRPLSPDAREKLAALLSLRSDFLGLRDRPAGEFWLEIERILREDGALRGDRLDASAAIRAREPYARAESRESGPLLPRQALSRTVGWFAGPIIEAQHSHDLLRFDDTRSALTTVDGAVVSEIQSRTSERIEMAADRAMPGLTAEYHRPLGPRWQVDATERVEREFRRHDPDLDWINDGTLGYIAAERWVGNAEAQFERFDQHRLPVDGSGRLEGWNLGLHAGLTYYLQDRLGLTLTADRSDQRIRSSSGASLPVLALYQRSLHLGLALQYRFLGTLEAPGLMSARAGTPFVP